MICGIISFGWLEFQMENSENEVEKYLKPQGPKCSLKMGKTPIYRWMNLSKSQSEQKQGKPSDLRYTLKASRGKRCIIYDPSDANNDDFFIIVIDQKAMQWLL